MTNTTKKNQMKKKAADMTAVKVIVRTRDLNKYESVNGRKSWKVEAPHAVVQTVNEGGQSIPKNHPGKTHFTFNNVFDENASTKEVYEESSRDIIESFVNGISGNIITYGQTSAGKTYTMQGDNSIKYGAMKGQGGIIQMAARDIFVEIAKHSNCLFLFRVSIIEVYNEDIRDLLADSPDDADIITRYDPKLGLFVDAIEEYPTDYVGLIQTLSKADKNRKVRSTGMNERSSRSHTMFRIILEQKPMDNIPIDFKKFAEDGQPIQISTLNLIDLAGSDTILRFQRLDNDTTREGQGINKSLLALSHVVTDLSKGQKKHINFRDSNLTRILQPYLTGNLKFVFICCITPSALFTEQTRKTLEFGTFASGVKTKATVEKVLDDRSMIIKTSREINDARAGIGIIAGVNDYLLGKLEVKWNSMESSMVLGGTFHGGSRDSFDKSKGSFDSEDTKTTTASPTSENSREVAYTVAGPGSLDSSKSSSVTSKKAAIPKSSSSSVPDDGSAVLSAVIEDMETQWNEIKTMASSKAPSDGSAVLSAAIQDMQAQWSEIKTMAASKTTVDVMSNKSKEKRHNDIDYEEQKRRKDIKEIPEEIHMNQNPDDISEESTPVEMEFLSKIASNESIAVKSISSVATLSNNEVEKSTLSTAGKTSEMKEREDVVNEDIAEDPSNKEGYHDEASNGSGHRADFLKSLDDDEQSADENNSIESAPMIDFGNDEEDGVKKNIQVFEGQESLDENVEEKILDTIPSHTSTSNRRVQSAKMQTGDYKEYGGDSVDFENILPIDSSENSRAVSSCSSSENYYDDFEDMNPNQSQNLEEILEGKVGNAGSSLHGFLQETDVDMAVQDSRGQEERVMAETIGLYEHILNEDENENNSYLMAYSDDSATENGIDHHHYSLGDDPAQSVSLQESEREGNYSKMIRSASPAMSEDSSIRALTPFSGISEGTPFSDYNISPSASDSEDEKSISSQESTQTDEGLINNEFGSRSNHNLVDVEILEAQLKKLSMENGMLMNQLQRVYDCKDGQSEGTSHSKEADLAMTALGRENDFLKKQLSATTSKLKVLADTVSRSPSQIVEYISEETNVVRQHFPEMRKENIISDESNLSNPIESQHSRTTEVRFYQSPETDEPTSHCLSGNNETQMGGDNDASQSRQLKEVVEMQYPDQHNQEFQLGETGNGRQNEQQSDGKNQSKIQLYFDRDKTRRLAENLQSDLRESREAQLVGNNEKSQIEDHLECYEDKTRKSIEPLQSGQLGMRELHPSSNNEIQTGEQLGISSDKTKPSNKSQADQQLAQDPQLVDDDDEIQSKSQSEPGKNESMKMAEEMRSSLTVPTSQESKHDDSDEIRRESLLELANARSSLTVPTSQESKHDDSDEIRRESLLELANASGTELQATPVFQVITDDKRPNLDEELKLVDDDDESQSKSQSEPGKNESIKMAEEMRSGLTVPASQESKLVNHDEIRRESLLELANASGTELQATPVFQVISDDKRPNLDEDSEDDKENVRRVTGRFDKDLNKDNVENTTDISMSDKRSNITDDNQSKLDEESEDDKENVRHNFEDTTNASMSDKRSKTIRYSEEVLILWETMSKNYR
eukprot:CAMPEP_0194126482 /NCGR_PEP_ID=MMETSP0150-20130528/60012_1 /TAXON_ID=122233 /ORGANISM="Chaetoceros debilis, Strain MM31A-1" /LENGTH=1592 /DNA_ID=CAMNT_0038820343 /DNA_START=79 /DNA_END=4854 /DNA_ORIENTATION=-